MGPYSCSAQHHLLGDLTLQVLPVLCVTRHLQLIKLRQASLDLTGSSTCLLVTTKIDDDADWHTSTRESLKPETDSAEETEEASHQGEQRAAWMADTNCIVWSVS